MVRVKFSYRDELSKGEWRTQEFVGSSVEECKRIYGLDDDPTLYEYRIDSVEEV